MPEASPPAAASQATIQWIEPWKDRANESWEDWIAVVTMLAIFGSVWAAPFWLPLLVYGLIHGHWLAIGILATMAADCCLPAGNYWPEFRHWELWNIWRRYFRQRLLRHPNADVDEKSHFIFTHYPHGVYPMASWIAFTFLRQAGRGFSDNTRGGIASVFFSLPILKHYYAWMGCIPVDKHVLMQCLEHHSLGQIPEGIAGVFMPQTPEQDCIYIKKRVGFVKLAIQTGIDIMPIYHLGQSEIFSVQGFPWLSRVMRITFVIFWGRWGLPIPRRQPSVTCVGEPIKVRQEDNPSQEQAGNWKTGQMAMEQPLEGKDYSFPKQEQITLKFWEDTDAFHEQLRRSEGKQPYIFFDGPPFATGLPHYGHLLAGTIKDIVTRYATGTGHHCPRRFGWDCHGLPVEYEIDKKLGITHKEQVLEMGIDKYNEECRAIVMRYSKEWETTVWRMGRWIDFKNDYKTLNPSFMESVWWVFQQLFNKGLVYKGFKVMPYSTGCTTVLSNFEAGLNYKDVNDPAVMVGFPLDDDPDEAQLVIWTTTPWTLPSNLAIVVHPDLTYIKMRDPQKGRVYIVAEARMEAIPGAVPKQKKGKRGSEADQKGFEVLEKVKGRDLAGRTYKPLFPYFQARKAKGSFKICMDTYVTANSGTGLVHSAPAFGEDDYRVSLANGIFSQSDPDHGLPIPVDNDGRLTAEITDFAGMYVKEADKEIVAKIKAMGRLVEAAVLNHSYPFCWRSETPLIYRAVPSWFVRVEVLKERLLANNAKTSWVPTYVKEKRFHNWLENAHDWAISRSRFWGTPLPVWSSEDGDEVVVIGSQAQLEELSGVKVTDLHRHHIDGITIPSKKGKGDLRRIDDVFDCWFESGSMPYASVHYPFENAETFADRFPADFVAEGLDQTRGWFYTLMVLSTALFDKPAFKSLVCNGLVLAEDGKKMSKRLKNYPDPMEVVNEYGADALRMYLINSPVVRAESLRFRKEGVFAVVKDLFLPWYNAYRFLVQNVLRMESETGTRFDPTQVDQSKVTNVLDKWIGAATRSLIVFVREEMGAYRLYTVVPRLVKFIDDLTNIYVRYNRRRLKGRSGDADCTMGLACLYDVLVTLCKVMAPFTPFFVESMYQNLRKCAPAAPESVHYTSIPEPPSLQAGDDRIQESVARMQRVIELSRVIREGKRKPLKMPLQALVVVHQDQAFLDDISGDLREYVTEELNVQTLQTCSDPLQYSTMSAVPDFAAIAARLGNQKAQVAELAKVVRAMTAQQLMQYEAAGGIDLGSHHFPAGEIKVRREFRVPEGSTADETAGETDGEVLAVLDLRIGQEQLELGLAREVVNRVQKLRKHAGLVATDVVQVFVGTADRSSSGSAASTSGSQPCSTQSSQPGTGLDSSSSGSSSSLDKVLESRAEYIEESLQARVLPLQARSPYAVVRGSEVEVISHGTEQHSLQSIMDRIFVTERRLLFLGRNSLDW
ncbi:hypothetical protein WJX84_010606 [Apatococcus fuscideae]|uniref:isoleucine--tRNA ligase n=1 Tax=Apatococcus fuscideae TaxID=2026836 RepID=A0AAW1T6S2_9CHLO